MEQCNLSNMKKSQYYNISVSINHYQDLKKMLWFVIDYRWMLDENVFSTLSDYFPLFTKYIKPFLLSCFSWPHHQQEQNNQAYFFFLNVGKCFSDFDDKSSVLLYFSIGECLRISYQSVLQCFYKENSNYLFNVSIFFP